jgi:hypothetical protein
MAMLVLNDVFARTWGPLAGAFSPPEREFWSDAVAALPGFIWIAEVYWGLESRLQDLGFRFTYDKGLYDRLRHASPPDVRRHLELDVTRQSRLVRFLENHDESRSAAVFGRERLEAAATLVATLPGLRFYHHGQLEGRRVRLPVQLGRAPAEAPDEEIRRLYERLLRLSDENVFHAGEFRLLDVRAAGDESFQGLIAYRWRAPAAEKLVAVNLSAAAAQGRVVLADGVDPSRNYALVDQLHDARYERAGTEMVRDGLFVRLEAHRAHVFGVSVSHSEPEQELLRL